MCTLGIDTSTSNLSIALLKNETVLAVSEIDNGMTHSINIISMIDYVLDKSGIIKSNISLISVDEGPGSFTSVRIGVATARGLAQFGNYPIVAVNSLKILYENVASVLLPLYSDTIFLIPMIDGRKKKVYGSIFNRNKMIQENLDISPDDLINKIKEYNQKAVFFGSGAILYRELLEKELNEQAIFLPYTYNIPHAVNTALLGRKKFLEYGSKNYNYIIPNYVRKSDAEILNKD